jgi:hypothetical protein
MQNVLREILHCRTVTLSRRIKPGKSRHECAIYHGAAITPAPANTLCLGGVLALGGVLCRRLDAGHEVRQELLT